MERNGYKGHLHPQSFYQKNSFLPMLCRLSLKDVRLSHYKCKDRTLSDEPLSPKVSCIGQVKRNNKVIGFPSSVSTNSSANTTPSKTSTTHNHIKYIKLKKLFSSKNSITGSISTVTNNGSGVVRKKVGSKINGGDLKIEVINVCELDPPLPVIKKVQEPGAARDEINIWKRRFNGGGGIKGLQIDQIHLPNSNYLPPPTTV